MKFVRWIWASVLTVGCVTAQDPTADEQGPTLCDGGVCESLGGTSGTGGTATTGATAGATTGGAAPTGGTGSTTGATGGSDTGGSGGSATGGTSPTAGTSGLGATGGSATGGSGGGSPDGPVCGRATPSSDYCDQASSQPHAWLCRYAPDPDCTLADGYSDIFCCSTICAPLDQDTYGGRCTGTNAITWGCQALVTLITPPAQCSDTDDPDSPEMVCCPSY